MYNSFQLSGKYLRYYLTASNGKGHGMHSPFVFEFIRYVLNNEGHYDPPPALAALRRDLLKDARPIVVEDLGAGSRTGTAKQKSVRQIARAAIKPARLAGLLFRLVRHYRPSTVIELGTSLGLTTAYLAAGHPAAPVTTVEGSPGTAAIARENFHKLGAASIRLLEGNFDTVLPQVLNGTASADLAYIDGNHRYAPTMAYFSALLAKAHEGTILVFDDIHWSAEMEKAWTEIKAHPAVQYTIDVFFLGFVFFRKDFRVKQHFTVRY